MVHENLKVTPIQELVKLVHTSYDSQRLISVCKQYLSAHVIVLDPNAAGNFLHPDDTWLMTNPKPYKEASQAKIKGRLTS